MQLFLLLLAWKYPAFEYIIYVNVRFWKWAQLLINSYPLTALFQPLLTGSIFEALFPNSLVIYHHLTQLDFALRWNPLVLLLQLFLEAVVYFNFFAKRLNWKLTNTSALLESE